MNERVKVSVLWVIGPTTVATRLTVSPGLAFVVDYFDCFGGLEVGDEVSDFGSSSDGPIIGWHPAVGGVCELVWLIVVAS